MECHFLLLADMTMEVNLFPNNTNYLKQSRDIILSHAE